MRQTNRNKWILVLLVLCLAFIWGNSMLPIPQSKALSRWVLEWVRRLFGMPPNPEPEETLNDHLIRKIAHFLEYAALGGLFTLYLGVRRSDGRAQLRKLIAFGFGAAFLDETIQVFSSRGPGITDVWLDIAGYTVGCLIVLLVQEKPKETDEIKDRVQST